MAHFCIRLSTMAQIVDLPPHSGMVLLLRVIATAVEFGNIHLRRCVTSHRKHYPHISKERAGPQGRRFEQTAQHPVMVCGSSNHHLCRGWGRHVTSRHHLGFGVGGGCLPSDWPHTTRGC